MCCSGVVRNARYRGISGTVERGNSALKYVKTSLRNIMGQERLNALMLLYIHKDIALYMFKHTNIFFTTTIYFHKVKQCKLLNRKHNVEVI